MKSRRSVVPQLALLLCVCVQPEAAQITDILYIHQSRIHARETIFWKGHFHPNDMKEYFQKKRELYKSQYIVHLTFCGSGPCTDGLGFSDLPFGAWIRFHRQAIAAAKEPFGEVLRVGRNIAMRYRLPNGDVEVYRIAGKDPFVISSHGWDYKVLHFAYFHPDVSADGNTIRTALPPFEPEHMNLVLQHSRIPSLEEGKALFSRIEQEYGTNQLFLYFVTRPWLKGEGRIPLFFFFVNPGHAPSSEKEYESWPSMMCFHGIEQGKNAIVCLQNTVVQ